MGNCVKSKNPEKQAVAVAVENTDELYDLYRQIKKKVHSHEAVERLIIHYKDKYYPKRGLKWIYEKILIDLEK